MQRSNPQLKKEFQFFPTPPQLAAHLVELAQVEPHHVILEPSAGQGAIINAILEKFTALHVHCYELMEINRQFLQRIQQAILKGEDFLNNHSEIKYDRIIANPPFAKNQDIDHIREMFRLLKDGGRLISIASKHWQLSSNSKETDFKNWLAGNKATVSEIPPGTFKESGTMTGSVIIVIDKPALSPELLQYAKELNLIIQGNAFYGYSVYHADCSEAIGGFMDKSYSSFPARQSMNTDNYEQGLRFILKAYNEQRRQTLASELKKNQLPIIF